MSTKLALLIGVALILAVSALLTAATPGFTWECQNDVPDTIANEEAGLCVLQTPTPTKPPHHHKTPTTVPTATPTQITNPTATPTTVPTQPPTAAPTLAPTSAPSSPNPTAAPPTLVPTVSLPNAPANAPQKLVLVCHYEATTGMWELRHVTSGNARVEQGDMWPNEFGICAQPQNAPTPTQALQTNVPNVPAPPPTVPVNAPSVTEEVTPQLDVPETSPQPTELAPPLSIQCIEFSSDLWPIPDDNGDQLRDENGFPMWLNSNGDVVVGPLCEMPAPTTPSVPVQIPLN